MLRFKFYLLYPIFLLFSCSQINKENFNENNFLKSFESNKRLKFKELYNLDYDTIKHRLEIALNEKLSPNVYFSKPLSYQMLLNRPKDDIFAVNSDMFTEVVQHLIDSAMLNSYDLSDQRVFREYVAQINRYLYWHQFPLIVVQRPYYIIDYKNDFLFRNSIYLQHASFFDEDNFEVFGFFEYYSGQKEMNFIEESIFMNDYMLRGLSYILNNPTTQDF